MHTDPIQVNPGCFLSGSDMSDGEDFVLCPAWPGHQFWIPDSDSSRVSQRVLFSAYSKVLLVSRCIF